MKVGVIDIGGGMRDIYGAGVLDRCMQDGVRFDCCIGVSAGSANLITYLAGQRGRNYRFYSVYSKRRQFMILGNFLKNGSYFDFDYVYCGVGNSDGEDPLDHDAFMQSSADFFVVALNADTGQPHYFTKADFTRDNYQPLSASSCIPALNRPVVLGGTRYFDGGLADPMPVEKAFAEGCDKVILLLTHPVEHYMKAEPMPRIAKLFAKKYPAAAPPHCQLAAACTRSAACRAAVRRTGQGSHHCAAQHRGRERHFQKSARHGQALSAGSARRCRRGEVARRNVRGIT